MIVFALANHVSAYGQNDGVGQSAWYVYTGDHPVSKLWAIHVEAQARRSPVLANAQQILIRTGVDRKISSQWTSLAGYTYVNDTPPAGSTRIFGTELRHTLFGQIELEECVHKLSFSQTLRLENTFASSRAEDESVTWSFRQRLRYHLETEVPAFYQRHAMLPDYYAIYDEIALSIRPSASREVLNQNRVYAALGWKLGGFEKIELGYMYQFLPVSNGIVAENNNSLQITLRSVRTLRSLLRRDR